MAKYTKKEILAELGGLLQEKPLDSITVTELVERCGISRQAFYYHFSDLYGVVDYAILLMMDQVNQIAPTDWQKALYLTVAFLQDKRTVILNAYHAYERSYVEHYMRQWAKPLVMPRVHKAAVRQQNVTRDQAEFVATLFTQALVSIMLSWVDRGMPNSVLDRLDDFCVLMDGCIDFIMDRLAQKNERTEEREK